MSFLNDLGKFAGSVTGKVLGGSIRVVGEIVESKYIKEIGNTVEDVTVKTGETLGNVAGGVWNVGAGAVTNNKEKMNEGISDLNDAVSTTANGLQRGISYVADGSSEVYYGLKDGDRDRWVQGAKNLGKVAAVTVLAVGVIDVLDGADGTDTSNADAVNDSSDADGNS